MFISPFLNRKFKIFLKLFTQEHFGNLKVIGYYNLGLLLLPLLRANKILKTKQNSEDEELIMSKIFLIRKYYELLGIQEEN